MLHLFARFVVACTILLILAGSLVTSTGSGLAVPDWPTTYGWNMFTFPPSKWVGGIFYEHGHRLIASTVGLLSIILTAWLWRSSEPKWLKRLGATALAAVVLQGVLGGITVLYFLPTAVSTAHAGLAEIFFCLTTAIAVFTSAGWKTAEAYVDDVPLRRVATATTIVIYTQILVGATMRHMGAGLAIPDFPLMFGRLVPDHWSAAITVHFMHRLGVLVVTACILLTASRIWRHHRGRTELSRPILLLVALIVVQVALGGLTVLSQRDVTLNSAHVVVGALVLVTSLVVTLRTWRPKFADADSSRFLARLGSRSASGGEGRPDSLGVSA